MSEDILLSDTIGCIPKVVSSWRCMLSSIRLGHRVCPIESTAPKNCEFIIIDSKIRICVIHFYPRDVEKFRNAQALNDLYKPKRNSRCSITEEYWFTKWNNPLRNDTCNCSFRRSARYSIISNEPTIVQKQGEKFTLNKRINNIETFVDCLVRDSCFQAFQEYFMVQKNGNFNYAFENTEDDVPVLRNRVPNVRDSALLPMSQILNKIKIRLSCIHKKKPLIMLLHGIGMSADVWSVVINAFAFKGFEVIAPDLLGHGFSSAPDNDNYYTFSNLLLQALTIFDYYVTSKNRKCILIGHSYSCSLITAMYSRRVPYVAQLVLVSGGGPVPLAPPATENNISPIGCVYSLLHPLLYCGVKRSFFYTSRGKSFKVCSTENGLPLHVVRNILKGQVWPEGDAAFHRRIFVPTLLVHGLQDKNVSLVQECEMERTIPRAFLEVIPNAGHIPMLETPEQLVHMISCFLDMWS